MNVMICLQNAYKHHMVLGQKEKSWGPHRFWSFFLLHPFTTKVFQVPGIFDPYESTHGEDRRFSASGLCG